MEAEDVITKILEEWPARSVARLRCTCRSWYSISRRPSFLLKHFRRSRAHFILFQTFPRFDLHDQRSAAAAEGASRASEAEARCIEKYRSARNSWWSSIAGLPPLLFQTPTNPQTAQGVAAAADGGGKIALFEFSLPPSVPYFSLVDSCDGLVCFQYYNYSEDCRAFQVYNPLTGEFIHLPGPTGPDGCLMGFYLHPCTGEYRILWASSASDDMRRPNFRVLSVTPAAASSDWRRLRAELPPNLPDSFRPAVAVNGSLHWAEDSMVLPNCNILAFDVETEEFRAIAYPASSGEYMWNCRRGVLDVEGRLGCLVVGLQGMLRLWARVGMPGSEDWQWVGQYSVRLHGDMGWFWDGNVVLWDGEEKELLLSTSSGPVLFNYKTGTADFKFPLEEDGSISCCFYNSVCFTESLISFDSFTSRNLSSE